ncbi:Casein kinase II subunit beta [Taphrina deformans PYCC 5710]|uniref:Casein kinase II subunit beta n=1 Tax=Taphrina deformans (strain PYCC 5710 / ATCC 11124 / CBS 356.35 / IMI 108563 / JCM 9778 / NBRC 8474) TaxID=1097556 RepID=R4X9E9_TAPDE|nr:Casein kinase II subunit beta [Taphrina deformans PYCC 5710]|eukprot:CCG82366.1 Casein kinase II subunit beta [Taphrina deformans PYCC 5710]
MAHEFEDFASDSLVSDDSVEEAWSSGSQTSSEEHLSWISWWCAHQGHEFFAEVPEEFIEDDFNMTGLSSMCSLYKEALELILDLEPDDDSYTGAAEQDAVEAAAEYLFTYIHQRYICSRNGLITMAEKYEAGHFGVCPRVMCKKTAVLPVGLYDVIDDCNVKLFCPSCLDIYNPPNSRFQHVEGANFGTTFPHLFFMTFPELLPPARDTDIYRAKIYGFKVSEYAPSGPRMGWLRQYVEQGRPLPTDEDGNPIEIQQEKPIPSAPGNNMSGPKSLDKVADMEIKKNQSTNKEATAPTAIQSSKGPQRTVVAVRESRQAP